MTQYDWEHVYLLLEVVRESAGHPRLKNLTSAAFAELHAIANPPPEEEEVKDEADASAEPPMSNARRA